jgi:hypothetical protein
VEHSFINKILLIAKIEYIISEKFIYFFIGFALPIVRRIITVFENYNWEAMHGLKPIASDFDLVFIFKTQSVWVHIE